MLKRFALETSVDFALERFFKQNISIHSKTERQHFSWNFEVMFAIAHDFNELHFSRYESTQHIQVIYYIHTCNTVEQTQLHMLELT